MQVTTPVVQENVKGGIDYVGSAVGICLGEVRLVATAAHVADLRSRAPLLGHGRVGLALISGDVTRVFSTIDPRDDSIDISVFRLPPESWGEWHESAFANWTELDLSNTEPLRHTFLVTGFPASKNRNSLQGNELSSQAYQMAALEAERSSYDELGRDSQLHLVLGFDKKKMWGPEGLRTAPDPYGMSGSAAWRVGRHLRTASEPPRLSAILVEWHRRGKHKHILATRIQVVLAAMVQRYPDIRRAVRQLE